MADTDDHVDQHGDVPEVEEPPTRLRHGLLIVLAIAAFVVLLDQGTKIWAVAALDTPVPVIGDLLQLRLVRNSGAAFSMATGFTWVFTIIASVVAIAIVRMSRSLGSRLWALALGLLLGGALGNLVDRLFREPSFGHGHVVDFIELPNFPLFNLADSAITCAAALILLAAVRGIGIDGRPVK